MSGTPGDIPGYDVERVTPWVAEHVPSLEPPFTWTQLEGGHSNLTFQIDGANGNSAVIRRPPLGELLPKAHDMGREWACISAMWGTGVPVAEPLAFCESPDVTGAHFYVMGLVNGRALYSNEEVEDWVPVERRPTMAHSWIDVLAALHRLDPDEVGLGDLGRREDYVARQINRWYGSWTASQEAADYDRPVVHELFEFLNGRIPEQGPAKVVHGDYGTHNVMIGPDGTVAAVVDWEIATLGDPLADFAYAINAWVEPGDPLLNKLDAPTLAPGFPGRQELIDRYAEASGLDITDLDYYRAYNHFRSACILHGVYARYRNGQKEIDPTELEEMRERLDRCVAIAELSGNELR